MVYLLVASWHRRESGSGMCLGCGSDMLQHHNIVWGCLGGTERGLKLAFVTDIIEKLGKS